MLHVDLDNILTQDELAHRADEVLHRADDEGKILVVTRNGRPAVAILKLEQLEELSGRTVSAATPPTALPEESAPAPASEAPSMPPPPESVPAPTPPAPQNPNPAGLPDMPDTM